MVKLENNLNNHADVYRPSETSRLQAQRKRDRLRSVQEKRRSLHEGADVSIDNETPDHIRRAESTLRKSSDENEGDIGDRNSFTKKYGSPFYDPAVAAQEELDQGYESPEEAPRVMSPTSVLKHRGYSRIITGGNSSASEILRNTENNVLFPKQREEPLAPVVSRPRDARNTRKPSVRQILGEPVPLPYLMDNSLSTQNNENKVVNILTNNRLENKNKRVNQNFQRLISRNKENIARRLRELNLQHQPTQRSSSQVLNLEPEAAPSVYHGEVPGNDFGTESKRRFSSETNEQQSSDNSHNADISSIDSIDKIQNEVDTEEQLNKLQQSIDQNGEKLDTIISMLKQLPGPAEPSHTSVSKYRIFGTLCIIILSLEIYLYVYVYKSGYL
ncbi:hypothetical protein DAKH74_055200 [Maudiozyma humilis]|uniref:Uncharacterized protein n=1 Tax=Maudiozyma humilis TaxID=51915 RepID=A0AAV5SA22_MAUHU|nr:hypothetical protein DAKH74_055200 [Kazachstania humilis]